jgi:hypothetical protein
LRGKSGGGTRPSAASNYLKAVADFNTAQYALNKLTGALTAPK